MIDAVDHTSSSPRSNAAADPAITEKDMEALRLYELELPDRTLLSGPSSRIKDLTTLFRICVDMLRAFRVLHFVGPCVTIFGSARVAPGSRYYEMARRMGAESSRLGFTVMTGGGPGIMQAGNQGAYEIGGRSVGVNIELPFEQHLNPYVHRSLTIKYWASKSATPMKAFRILNCHTNYILWLISWRKTNK